MTDDREARIRRKAKMLWEEEGRPQGRDDEVRDRATELVAIEDNQELATTPVKESEEAVEGARDGEPLAAWENEGEFPTLTDQGEQERPHREDSERR